MTGATCRCGRPTAGAALCPTCSTTLAYAILHVGVYAVDLENVAGKTTRYGTTSGGKSAIGRERPLPVDLRFVSTSDPDPQRHARHAPGAQLRADVLATLTRWHRTVARHRPPVAGPVCTSCDHDSCDHLRRRHRPLARTVPTLVHYLAGAHRWACSQPWAPDMLDELVNLEQRLARMVDRPPDLWYAGKCSDTDATGNVCLTDVYARTDRGVVTCRGCGAVHDVSSRRTFLLEQARDYHVTATQAAGALIAWTEYDGSEAKLVDRIRKWRDRERLDVADVTSLHGRDRHLYRLGDIQDLLADDAHQRQAKALTSHRSAC
ncbi:hypothetical protein GCM10023340_08350 [Nocardioides marinquilinus]|uniref:Uncharacterized protein n=1 Tax=Nocardioides marinquilinus TaxID=1210400 RepID=A0ABP9PAA3_9ACTN